MLTTEELIQTFPKLHIKPHTFLLKKGYSIFIGGLSRLDFIDGINPTYFTVFCAESLPITICETKFAEDLYEKFVGTALLGVPIGTERLKLWPYLKASKEIKCTGVDHNFSCIDVLLSSSGNFVHKFDCILIYIEKPNLYFTNHLFLRLDWYNLWKWRNLYS